ncbi:hypothetical protein [Streptomyces platensis]|uniref:hypothetical protein n=1 Tax=Streptomyces platensis TaxID=58346 RepID=UPI00378A0658
MPAELAAARADEIDADTVNRDLSIARKAIGWWQRQGRTAAEHEPTPAPHSLTVSPGRPGSSAFPWTPTRRPSPRPTSRKTHRTSPFVGA